MKKTLVLTTIALLVSGSATAKTWVLTNAEEGMDKRKLADQQRSAEGERSCVQH